MPPWFADTCALSRNALTRRRPMVFQDANTPLARDVCLTSQPTGSPVRCALRGPFDELASRPGSHRPRLSVRAYERLLFRVTGLLELCGWLVLYFSCFSTCYEFCNWKRLHQARQKSSRCVLISAAPVPRFCAQQSSRAQGYAVAPCPLADWWPDRRQCCPPACH